MYEKIIPENNRRGQILLRVQANDDDIGENARISYSLLEADESKVRIDARGNIIAMESLDYETTPELLFKVVAKDHGQLERRLATADVNITVTDVNDEYPIFHSAKYRFNILENMKANTTVGRVSASDKDSGENGNISYSIISPEVENPFQINASSGVITTKEELDREYKPNYTLVLMAADHGKPPKKANATVTVIVMDQNDHKPRIIYPKTGNSSLALTFDTKPGTVVLTVLAEDDDIGSNRELQFHLASSSGRFMFEMNKNSGELTLRRELTVQDAGRHRLTVVVTDKSGSFPRASNTTFDVLVFAPNVTNTPEENKEKEHVMVVIILGVITGIVTVAVIITIVVLRRADSQRRKYVQSRTKLPPSEMDNENVNQALGNPVVVKNGGGGSGGNGGGGGGFVISNHSGLPDGGMKGGKGKDGGNSGEDFSSRDVTQDEGFADKSVSKNNCMILYM